MSDHSLLHEVIAILKRAGRVAFPTLPDFCPDVAQSKDPAFGDYQCNSAMKLAKQLSAPPRSLAQALIQALPQEASDLFESVDIAGPGFINLKLRPEFLAKRLMQKVSSGALIYRTDHGKRVVIVFSSPNIAK